MSVNKCALCACEMTVEVDGTSMHQGRVWPETDRTFCLKRQLDIANARIKRLEEALLDYVGVTEQAKAECIFGKEAKP